MRVVARYASQSEAKAAAHFLLEHGIVAGVTYAHLATGEGLAGVFNVWNGGQGEFRVVLARGADYDDAKLVVEAFSEQTVELHEGWEASAEPDLSLLDPELLPDCPACGYRLPADSDLGSCPKCHFEVDVPALIVSQRGPEALDGCFGDASPHAGDVWISDEALSLLSLQCGRCAYDLSGLADTGACPECGEPFDKREAAARLLGDVED